jgi:ribosomal protection tetracycline resistance protein
VRTLNLGILAHVDAGKTTLTERLLFAAGVIDELGSVDDGSTQTDTLDLERQRGITIKSAVVSFAVGDVTVNLIDTPGHPDFIAEVERVLGVLDGAVLVVSAVEGVQAQTRVLMRTLQRLGIPTLLFINKIDRAGADTARVLRGISDRLTPAVIAMGAAVDQGSRRASFEPFGPGDEAFAARLADLLAEHDDTLLADYVHDASMLSYGRLAAALGAQARVSLVHPVFAGSAMTHAALTQLAEQDPLINLRQDDARSELLVSLYGEVQKEVIQATLAGEFGMDVGFEESTTICIERPVGTGAAVEVIGQAPNPFLAGVGLRVDPAPPGSGVEFGLEIELGALPFSFLKAVAETVHETLRQGIYGWQVTDIAVTMTQSGYWPRQSHAHAHFDKSMSSTAGDFRNLTPLVIMSALSQAGTRVYEPIHRFLLEVPADTLGSVLPLLARLLAVPLEQATRGSLCVVAGDVPAAAVHRLQRQLPALTRGEGVVESAFDHYEAVRGEVPARPRSDHNPLNRKEYLLHVSRGVAGFGAARLPDLGTEF